MAEAEEQSRQQQVRGPAVGSDRAEAAGFLAYMPTQAPPVDELLPEANAPSAAELPDELGEPFEDCPRAAPAQHAPVQAEVPRLLLMTDAEVPAMNVGYGEGGASVQVAIAGLRFLPDRVIMQRVLLRGEALVSVKKVCDTLKMKPDGTVPTITKPMSLKANECIAVIRAALNVYKVAAFEPQGWVTQREQTAAVRLRLPNANDPVAVAKYHNLLMKCCSVSYAQVLKTIKQRDERGGGSLTGPRPDKCQTLLILTLQPQSLMSHPVRRLRIH